VKFTKIEIIQRVNFDKYFRRNLMKKFLWLVVALATMVLVGCSNNAGGGTSNGTNGSNGTSSNQMMETETHSGLDKMDLYQKYLQTRNSIMTMIYKDLDILFYGLAD
jgi:hypothetical protein